MAFHSTADARLYLHYLALHAYARNASASSGTGMLDTTTLDKRAKTFIPDRLEIWSASFDGPLDVDATAGGQYAALSTIKAAMFAGSPQSYPFTYAPLGADGGLWLGDSMQTALDTMTAVAETVNWSAGLQGTGLLDQNGKILENNTAVTVDTDGTTLDNGAATTDGAAAHLHVTEFSGLTSDVVIIEASTSGAFAGEETTLITFSTVSGLTSERKTVTGTVPRYLRVADDVTGTGSISRFVAISRR